MRRVYLLIILCFLVSCQQNNPQLYADVAPLGHPSYDCGVIANFPDENLEAAVKKQLGVSSRDALTCEKLKTLTVLDASNKGIKDLTGLQNAWRLQNLNAQRNQITTIDVVSSLYQLQILDIGDNQVSDISPVTKITQLRELHLWKNQITDISPVTKLTRLYTLKLWNNQVTDINALQNLKKLAFIDLSRNQIVDISPLANNAGLNDETQINLIRNKLDLNNAATASDISKLKGKGIQLRLDHQAPDAPTEPTPEPPTNPIPPTDPTVCSNPVNIPDANLKAAIQKELGISNAPTCQDLLNLKRIDAKNGQISDLTGLQFATNLTGLRLSGNPVQNITPIRNLPKLYNLFLDNTGISDLASLAGGLQSLTYFVISNNAIKDISPLADLQNLIFLDIQQNKIEDVSPIATLRNLTEINASNNEITSFASINMPKLRFLNLNFNLVYALNSFEVNKLEVLRLTGNCLDTRDTRTEDSQAIEALRDRGIGVASLRQRLFDDSSPCPEEAFDSNPPPQPNPTPNPEQANCADPLQIPDEKLANVIKRELSLANNTTLLCANLLKLDKLESDNEGISDLTGIQYATNLRTIDIRNSPLSHIETLKDLPKLTSIDFRNTEIEDISGWEGGLLALTNLTISHPFNNSRDPHLNSLKDMKAIANLPNLVNLSLTVGRITTVPPLNLPNAKSIGIVDNEITTFEKPINLRNLERLVFLGNDLTELPQLDLPNLTSINVDENRLTNLDALSGMPKLTRFSGRNNRITDISGIQNLKSLTNFVALDNSIIDISAFENLPELKDITIFNNKISDLGPLARNTNFNPDSLSITGNCLDLSTGRTAANRDIDTLQLRGIIVPNRDFNRQKLFRTPELCPNAP